MNAIYIQRCGKVVLKQGAGHQHEAITTAMQKNLEAFGFRMSPALVERVATLDEAHLTSFYHSLLEDLRKVVGAHRVFEPMYPDFPRQVYRMSEQEWVTNALVHYITNQRPVFDKTERAPLTETTKLREIDLGDRDDFESIFRRLAGAKTSLSPTDQQDLI